MIAKESEKVMIPNVCRKFICICLCSVGVFSSCRAAEENFVNAEDLEWRVNERFDAAFERAFRSKLLIGGRGNLPSADGEVLFGISEWAPGAIYIGHKHPQSEIYYIISGEGEWTVDGKTIRVKPGTAVFTRANTVHRMVNTGDEVLQGIWFLWPPNGDTSLLSQMGTVVEPIAKQPEHAVFSD